MKLIDHTLALDSLQSLKALGLVMEPEVQAILSLDSENSELADAVDAAETVHLHVKVDNTDLLPINEFFDAGARLDHQKPGFVKYRFPGGINAIFSHIKVAQEELAETETNRRARPFLDHIGIDLRDDSETTRSIFDSLPDRGKRLHWAHAGQGGRGRPVYCCHVEVAEKHWLYPADNGHPGIPLEFAFGPLIVNAESSGCDLRPANPLTTDPDAIPKCVKKETTRTSSTPAAENSYYRTSDLARFGEIGRKSSPLADAFFGYYAKVMEDGALTSREKALIALATAHSLKCPYCIDSLTTTCVELGLTESQMMEAVHTAAAMGAGITLVHSTQMLGHLDAAAS